ncbi:hypothetical protein [Roseovarius sp.]|uniref:hypothetical protein n=1 Tax=Roseovarius sp. TaxID=1486281 RepID=UPI003A97567E
MDEPGSNSLRMRKFASLIAVMFLVVFAASTIVHAVSANAMALDMAMADGGAMSMPECQGCPEGGDSDTTASCDLICTAPVFAMVKGTAAAQFTIAIPMREWPLGMTLPRGLQAPPDPFPPRTLI